ncbi:unnamed protein product [Chironomus riparius]|uniref:Uncharacterized protein n=1 Tax=Chironomus riparius TaxID=315576 RepID=A0A9N9WU85_9DIPT|nr:unnamed protein product [Chironomus riparius]
MEATRELSTYELVGKFAAILRNLLAMKSFDVDVIEHVRSCYRDLSGIFGIKGFEA